MTRCVCVFLLALMLSLQGCRGEVDVFAEPGAQTEKADVLRQGAAGCVLVSYASYPLRKDAPPDGVRAALMRAIDGQTCSAAAFYWTENLMAERWIREQLARRAAAGRPQQLILAGHGLGATAAAETARAIMASMPEAQILLLLTVDAVKTGRISSTAGYAGNQIANRMGLRVNLVAYDGAPMPDNVRLLSHVNYYQNSSEYYHGAPMPGASNHHIADTSGVLNHADIDDFILPLAESDIAAALRRAAP